MFQTIELIPKTGYRNKSTDDTLESADASEEQDSRSYVQAAVNADIKAYGTSAAFVRCKYQPEQCREELPPHEMPSRLWSKIGAVQVWTPSALPYHDRLLVELLRGTRARKADLSERDHCIQVVIHKT